jgi:ABC-type uncharacterized transport system substrate-binding protein
MIDRRRVIGSIGVVALAWPLPARTQPSRRVARIGIVSAGGPSADMAGPQPNNRYVRAFLRGMAELGYIFGRDFVTEPRGTDAMPAVADLVGLQVDVIVATGAGAVLSLQIAAAFNTAADAGAGALLVPASALLFSRARQIAELAALRRLPTMYELRPFVDSGGLVSYGANIEDIWRSAATYVDKILRGARPAELPIEQPTKFELVINSRAATALGLTIPPSILISADEVID